MNLRLRLAALAAAGSVTGLVLTGCTPSDSTTTTEASVEPASATSTSSTDVWDPSVVHDFAVDYDESDFEEMLATYLATEEKTWIEATVTIDGVTYERVGLKLKGNSSLRGITADTAPEDLPWIIRLDKFVEGQTHEGATEFAVRSNSMETSLNEAVSLDLLDMAGLASEEAIAVAFSVEGSAPTLRLVVENPNDAWMERELGDGLLYKAEAGGDYSYRGDDPAAYEGVFDQEGGDDDVTPLIEFLAFINESDDDTFAAELAEHLDIDAFATYLAFQEIVENSDDIDGPGNNSYLYFDPSSGLMTVVTWDLNLTFGASPGSGEARNGGGMPDQGAMPEEGVEGTMPAPGDAPRTERGGDRTGGGGMGGGMGGGNVLAERFLANADFAALVDAELDRLTSALIDSGDAADLVTAWTETLLEGAPDTTDRATIEEEAASLAARLNE